MAQLVERKPFKFNVTGSNPVFCTKAVPSICGRGGTAYAADFDVCFTEMWTTEK